MPRRGGAPAATGIGEENGRRLAVPISADISRAVVIEAMLAGVAPLGKAIVQRSSGDVTTPESAYWKKLLHKFSIKPIQQFS